jgi:hypothetical protein
MADPAHGTVSIHIDKKELKSPTPTTGKALYDLGGVDSTKYDLFRETRGKGEDEKIAYDGTPVALHEGDHFFSVPKKLNPGA